MGTTTKGKLVGSDPEFKQRKPKSVSGSLRLGAERKDSLEKKAIQDKQADEKAKAKEISRREKERAAMRTDLQKRVSSEETDPNRNTDARRKVVNVGRPGTAKNPMDPRSTLARQGEITRKIIEDQEKSMTLQKYHNLPDDLVSAVRSVLEGKNPFAKKDEDDKKKPSKKDDDKDDKDTKSKKSDDDDDDDEDDADKPVGKDGKKTKVDIAPTMKTANEELKGGQKKLDKNHNGKLDKQDFKMLRKEEVEAEHIAEEKTHTVWFQKGTKVGARSAKGVGVTAKNDKHAVELAKQQFPDHKNGWDIRNVKSHVKEEVEEIDEISTEKLLAYRKGVQKNTEKTPNGSPKAAVNKAIKHEVWRDHADELVKKKTGKYNPGILDRVKARLRKEETEQVTLSDEETARILAKLNEADDEDEKHDGPEHIVMQLRKAKSLGAANRPIHFHDGSKTTVSSAHVQKALDMHGSFKKAPDKDEFTKKLQASHASFKSAIGEK